MVTVALFPKFQFVIPKDIRSALNLVAGQRMEVQLNGDKVELIPDQTVASLSGRWPGVGTRVVRGADRV